VYLKKCFSRFPSSKHTSGPHQVIAGAGLKTLQLNEINPKETKMKKDKLLLLMLVLELLSLVLAACGSKKEANSPTGEPNFPTGKFINSGAPNYGLIFNEDGTFTAFAGSSTLVTGTYSVDGDTFTNKSDDSGCPPWSFKYTWDGTNLTFNYIGDRADDPCGVHRGNAFDNVTYTLSK
jgi:hypothetical protein